VWLFGFRVVFWGRLDWGRWGRGGALRVCVLGLTRVGYLPFCGGTRVVCCGGWGVFCLWLIGTFGRLIALWVVRVV